MRNKTKLLLVVAILAMAPLTGCIENMSDLKDRLSANQVEEEPDDTDDGLDGLADTNKTAGNATAPTNATPKRELKPPVARITIFAPGGALLFRSSFVAEDQTDAVVGNAGTFSLLSSDSEALTPGAELVKFEWEVDGEKLEGRKVDTELTDPGVHMVSLTVTDSEGQTDSQMVHIGIAPEPFDVVTTVEGGQQAGLWGDIEEQAPGVQTHEIIILDTVDGKSVTAQKLAVSLTGFSPTMLGAQTRLYDSEGTQVATGDEALEVANPPAGTYTLEVYVDGATDGYTGEITITYLEQVEGVGGDGHAHAH